MDVKQFIQKAENIPIMKHYLKIFLSKGSYFGMNILMRTGDCAYFPVKTIPIDIVYLYHHTACKIEGFGKCRDKLYTLFS